MINIMNSYNIGVFSELIACAYLILHGFRIVKRRYITGRLTNRAEIDIIAKKKDLLIFVEVKRRSNTTEAFNAITSAQIKRLRTAAETYILQKNWCGNARFDAIIITPKKLQWIKGAI